LGPFSKKIDLNTTFLDIKSSEIGKLCSKLGNEVKLASFTLPLMDMYAFEELSIIKCLLSLVKNESFQ